MNPEVIGKRVTFKDKAREWMIAARLFATPWMLVNTLLGVTLAGFSLYGWLTSFAVVFCVLLTGHFINDWRDFTKGLDKLIEGSTAKPYSAGSQVLPRGILSLRVVKVSAAFFFLASIALMNLLAPQRPDVWILYLIGITMALTYTDLFKPKGFGEVALFLGHGMGATCFSFAMIMPVNMTGISAGVLLGFWAGIIYTIDQWQDMTTDLANKVKNFSQVLFRANMRISQLWYFLLTGSIVMQAGMVLLGWLPAATLLTIFLLPMGHIAGVFLDLDFDKGVMLALATMWLFALIAAIGVWVYPLLPPVYFL